MATLSVEDFLAKARPLNPDYSDDELIEAYHEQYAKTQDPPTQTVSPAPLMTLEEFLPKAKALNPDYDDEELAEAWRETYGARGAREKDQGDVGRGFTTAFKQIPQLLGGVEAGAGAVGEKIFGEGGLFTALKEHGLRNYREIEEEIGRESKPSDSVTEAYKMARAGNPGALVDWLQHTLGYGGGQALQMLATAGIGYAGGKLALKTVAETAANKLIAKESARIAATAAGSKLAADAVRKQAVSNVAGKIGQLGALGATAVGMEGGEIFGGLVDKATKEGRSLTGAELAKATGATLAAGGLEFVGDKIGLDLVLGKSIAKGLVTSRLGHAAAAGTVGTATEGGTEFTQTLLEEFGKGNDPFSPESITQAIDAAAVGGVAGGAMGTIGGILNRPDDRADLQVTDRTEPERLALPAPPIYGEGPVYTPTGTVEEVIPGKGRLAGLGPGTQPEVVDGEVIPPAGPRQLTRSPQPPQPGEMYAGRVYGEGPVVDVSPLPDVSPVTNASTLDEAIAGAVGVVQGATETAKARAAEFAKMTSRARNEAERLIANAPEKRTGADTPILSGPVQTEPSLLDQPSPIVPAKALTSRRLKEEQAQLEAQREELRESVDQTLNRARALPSGQNWADRSLKHRYPSVQDLHRLAEEKGLQWDNNPVFMELTRMATGKAHLDALSPVERQKFADTLSKIKAPQRPAQTQEAPPQVPLTPVRKEKPYDPVTSIPEATVPRSALPPEKNAEVMLRAEKAKADMEIAGTERGGRFHLEQAGTGSTKEIIGLKSPTADWYKELTSGPSPAIRGDRKQSAREKIEEAIAKIIKDKGADRGKAVELVKAALLEDQEFHQTEWGRDLQSILDGEWPSWVEKPEGTSTTPSEAQVVPRGTPQVPDEVPAQQEAVEQAAHVAATSPKNDLPEPTEGQKEAGNYRKGHIRIAGLDISIENPAESERSGQNADGKPWSVRMKDHYGYIRGTKGKDKEHIDIFIKPGTPDSYNGSMFVVDQKNQDGTFDEHKVIMGATSEDEARSLYQQNYSKDHDGILSLKSFTMPEFKLWLKAGNKQKPAGNPKAFEKSTALKTEAEKLKDSQSVSAKADQLKQEAERMKERSQPSEEGRSSWYQDVLDRRENTPEAKADYEHLRSLSPTALEAELDRREALAEKDHSDEAADDAAVRVRSVYGDYVESRPLTSEELHDAVMRATHGFEGAEARWSRYRQSGISDQELREAISHEFGEGGGGSTRNVSIFHKGGSTPTLWIGSRTNPKKVLKGKELLQAVRDVLRLPLPQPEPEPFSLTAPTVKTAKAKEEDRQTSLDIPPETIGTRPIIGREAQPEEAPLFSKAAQEADAEQTTLPEDSSQAKIKKPTKVGKNGLSYAALTSGQEEEFQQWKKSNNPSVVTEGNYIHVMPKGADARMFRTDDFTEGDALRYYWKHNVIGTKETLFGEAEQTALDRASISSTALSPGERDMLIRWTTGDVDFQPKAINRLLDKLPIHQGLAYRGLALTDAELNGMLNANPFTLSENASASQERSVAEGFRDDGKKIYEKPWGALLTVHTRKAAIIPADIAEEFGFQKEVVLRPGQYRIEMTDRNESTKTVDVELWEKEAAQTTLPEEPAPSPTDILASALRSAADQIQGKQPSEAIDTLDKHDAFRKRLLEGEVTLDEYKQAFAQVRDNKDKLVAELKKLNKEQLVKKSNSLHTRRSESKDSLIEQAYDGMVRGFALNRGVSYMMTGQNAFENAITKMVEGTTADDLTKFAEEIAKNRADYQKRVQGFANPQTLQDFDLRVELRGEASLNPEQLARYDELLAQAGRAKRQQAKERQATVQGVDAGTDLQLIESKHTKTGEKLWVVKLGNRVDRAVYDQLNQAAHKLGGRYSSYNKDGAIPGFTFRSQEAANSFMAAGKGETVSAAPVRQAQQAEKQDNAVSRLRDMADRLREKADESLNRDRQTNTARRARMASSAENDAYANKALADTMTNLADAIESGEATHLSGLRTKAQVEMLDSMTRRAKYAANRKRYDSYAEQERHKDDPAIPEDAAFAEFPEFLIDPARMASINRDLKDRPGTERVRVRLMKVANKAKDGKDLPVDRRDVEEILAKYPTNSRFVTPPWPWTEALEKTKRLEAMGITSLPELRAALREFVEYRGKRGTIDKAKQLERGLIGKNVGVDFFPTPKETAQRMVAEADIQPGMKVLEPSAGNGNIAEAIRAAGVNPDVVELSSSLREILEAKGFKVVGWDFMDLGGKSTEGTTVGINLTTLAREVENAQQRIRAHDPKMEGGEYQHVTRAKATTRHANAGNAALLWQQRRRQLADAVREAIADGYRIPDKIMEQVGSSAEYNSQGNYDPITPPIEQYDRIVMNPPFSNGQDAEHIQHAYSLLKPGGKLVAIAGEGVFFRNDAKAKAFRAWLEEHGGTDEKLPEGTFKDSALMATTGVNARLVVVEKPETDQGTALYEPAPAYGSSAFKRWFGNSKVVDANGQPLVVYHGTPNKFDVFRPDKGKQYILGREFEVDRPVSFFTEDKGLASTFGKNIMSVYLKIERPLDLRDGMWGHNDKQVQAMAEEQFGPGAGFVQPDELWEFLDDREHVQKLKELGYDGVLLSERNDEKEAVDVYAVFEPTQIKSATGNAGTFDPTNPSIVEESGSAYTPTDSQALFERSQKYAVRPGEQQTLNYDIANEALGNLDRATETVSSTTGNLDRPGIPARTIGLGISTEFIQDGVIDLTGREVRSADDLAQLAQVYRDPRFETFRIFYVKNNAIVAHEGMTSRLPGVVKLFKSEAHAQEKMTAIQGRMDELGATGYYLLHNHPSGQSDPSRADFQVTEKLAMQIPGFKGHVVIDSNEYTVIDFNEDDNLQGKKSFMEEREDKLLTPSIPHPLLTARIRDSGDVVTLGQQIKSPDGYATVLYRTSGHGQVRAIQEVAVDFLSDPTRAGTYLREQAVAFGAQDIATHYQVAGDWSNKRVVELQRAMDQLIEDGIVVDHVVSGSPGTNPVSRAEQGITKKPNMILGQSIDDVASEEVQEERAAYNANSRRARRRPTDDISMTFPGMEEPQSETRPTGTISPDHARDQLKASKASLRPYLLGSLGLEQLAQVYGRDHAEVKGYNTAVQAMEADFVETSRASEQIVKAWTKLKIPVADQMAQVMEDARFLNFDPDPTSKQEADSQKKRDLRTRFDALPGEAQSTYRLARDFYTAMAESRFQALKERIERAGGTPENTKKLVDRLQIAYEQVRSKVYFPFSRFGENIVVAKKMENGVEKDREVHAFESTAEAQQFATLMKMKGWTVKQTVARQYSVDKEGPASKIVRQMHDIIKELDEQPGLPGVSNLTDQLLDSLNQSFLQALPDMSYAKHFIHAKDVKGASKDALRAFAHSALHGAHHISRIRHADRMTNALTKLDDRINKTDEGDTIEARQVYNELVQRHNEILNPSTHPVSAWLGQLGFTMSLGGVVATGVTNATQVPLITYPWLGARFGFNKASAALARAYKDFLDPRTLNADSLFDATKSKLISESERKMLLELARRGRIDLTQTMDLAGLSAQDNLSRVARQVGTTRGKVMRMLGFTFHAPEVMNRQVTALAAFRLEKDKGSSFEEALQRADQAIVDTHFIYTADNRPRYMSGNVLRVLTMFKQYSQNIAYLYGRAASIWLDRNNATAEERAVAKRQLISMLALQFGAAGALGMPFFGASADILMSVVAAFGDDDEKRDWEVSLRRWLDGSATSLAEAFTDDKEKARETGKLIGQVVSHGLPRLTPFDMANRLGQQDLFFRAPQREREGRQAAMDWLTSFSGPVVGYAVNGMLGVSDLAKGVKEGSAGFFMRGVEELTPAVVRNGVKALRYAMEDVRTRDQYKQLELRPDETLGQAFGFAPKRVAEMYESITAVRNKEHRAMNQRKTLLQRFARAVQERDMNSRRKILEDIRAFNSRNRMFGITSDTLNRSIKARRQHEAGMERGMYLPGKRRALLEEGEFGDF